MFFTFVRLEGEKSRPPELKPVLGEIGCRRRAGCSEQDCYPQIAHQDLVDPRVVSVCQSQKRGLAGDGTGRTPAGIEKRGPQGYQTYCLDEHCLLLSVLFKSDAF